MLDTPVWRFGLYRLDLACGGLWREDTFVPLPPKPCAVLAYLVAHAGQVVTKDALLQAIWPDIMVAEGVLKTYMGHIRQALGETARAPQYIVTVHRRGYRFIAPVTREEPISAAPPADVHALRSQAPPHLPHLMVGREAECAVLHPRFLQAQQGVRQIVLVTGEAGIGKTVVF